MGLAFKARRLRQWSRVLGAWEAARFEAAWTLRPPRVRVRVPGFPAPFVMRRAGSDLSVFETVFIDRELDLPLPCEPRLIIDGGANIGLSTAFFAGRYPGATVLAVEPDAANVELLQVNCAAFPNVRVLRGGLWSSSGHLRIVNPADPPWSFRCEPAEPGEPGSLRAYTLEEALALSGHERCDLLKLDIEGAERRLFENPARSWIHRIDAVLVEVHGEGTMSVIENACPADEYDFSSRGEKVLIRPRRGPPARDA